MTEIDLHIIHLPNEENILNVKSIEATGIVEIYHIEGIVGNTLKARLEGYSKGKNNYVSFADPDDLVEPTAFFDLLKEIKRTPMDGVYTNSIIFDLTNKSARTSYKNHTWTKEWHNKQKIPIHQLTLIKRESISKIIEHYSNHTLKSRADQFIFDKLTWKFIPIIGYYWYKRPNGNHKNK